MLSLLALVAGVAALLAAVLALASRTRSAPAELECVLFEPIEFQVHLDRTLAQRVGASIRYLLFLLDLLRVALVNVLLGLRERFQKDDEHRRSFSRLYFRFNRELWRKKSFFPSFKEWEAVLRRQEREDARGPRGASPLYRPPFEAVYLVGSLRLPERAYVNDACVLELTFAPYLQYASSEPAQLSLHKNRDGSTQVIAEWRGDTRSISVSLSGIGIDVQALEPEVQQNCYAFFAWGCSFKHSGLQQLVLRVTLVSGFVNTSARYVHRVRVVQFGRLTARQVRVVAGCLAVLVELAPWWVYSSR